jgi:hypothetical protein
MCRHWSHYACNGLLTRADIDFLTSNNKSFSSSPYKFECMLCCSSSSNANNGLSRLNELKLRMLTDLFGELCAAFPAALIDSNRHVSEYLAEKRTTTTTTAALEQKQSLDLAKAYEECLERVLNNVAQSTAPVAPASIDQPNKEDVVEDLSEEMLTKQEPVPAAVVDKADVEESEAGVAAVTVAAESTNSGPRLVIDADQIKAKLREVDIF